MIIKNLRINQLSAEAFAWYLHFLDALDARDITSYATFLSDDTTAQFDNMDVVRGKDAVIARLEPAWQQFTGLEHDLQTILGNDRSFGVESRNRYTRLDTKQVYINGAAFYDRNEQGLVSSVRMYTDMTPLFAP